ncbi:MAG TPA: hypothetical protein VG496_07535 [Myxococcales bacterium]|nr:hypothetical protein [Myxococcales bacterium]
MDDARITELVDRAFDYRGYVTLRRSDGSEVIGYVYDRGPSHLELFDETATRRFRVPLADIADIAFTGEDAARKSQEIWERRQGKLEPRDSPADGGWRQTGPVLVLVALERELRSVARALAAPQRSGLVRGRVGDASVIARAAGIGEAARRFVAEDEPRVVLSCGFAGALDASLAPGDLVIATEVRDAAGDAVAAAGSLRRRAAGALENVRCAQGPIVCTATVAATVEEKRALAASGGIAVDMESYAIARAAADAGVPWLALRAIVDSLESPLPAFTREANPDSLWPALKHGLSSPRAALGLLHLARNARRAGAMLEEALRRIVPALSAAEPAR